jgi:hypothetical protein
MNGAGSRGWDGLCSAFAFVLFTLSVLTAVMLVVAVAEIRLTAGISRLALAAAAALGWGLTRMTRRLAGQEDAPAAPLYRPDSGTRTALLSGILLLTALLYLVLWFFAVVAPERSWDGNIYHLPAIHSWLLAGRIHWIDPQMPLADVMNGYPKGAEVMGMVAVKLTGSPSLSHCQNLLFLPLGFLALACLGRLAGVGPLGALVCAALFVLVPVNLAQSVTTYVDTAYACCLAAFLAALGMAVRHRRAHGSLPWHLLPLLGSAFGLAVGVRPTALFLLPGAFAGLAVLLPRHGATHARSRPRAYGGALLFVAAAGLWGSMIGGFWYARNLRQGGNPFYPVRIDLFGKTMFAGRDLKDVGIVGHAPSVMQGWSRPRQILYAWAGGLSEWPRSILGQDALTGGLGWLWLLGCVPSILLLSLRAVRDPGARDEFAPLMACAGVVLLAFLVMPENWWARYTIWIHALGLPAFTRVARDVFTAGRSWNPAKAWVATCVGVALLEACLAGKEVASRSYPGPRPLRLGEALLAENWRWPSNFLFPRTRGTLLDQVLAGSETVAFGPTLAGNQCRVRNGMVGQLAQPVGGRRILPIPLDSGEGEYGDLVRRGAKYLIWDTGAIAPHCAPPEALLRLGSPWTQADGFWIAPMRGAGSP